jgi:hypothetical protein
LERRGGGVKEFSNAMKNAVVKFRSHNKMAEESFSSRSSFRSIIFVLLAFLAVPVEMACFELAGAAGREPAASQN